MSMSVSEIPLDIQIDMPVSVLAEFHIKYVRVHVVEDAASETEAPQVKNVFKMMMNQQEKQYSYLPEQR